MEMFELNFNIEKRLKFESRKKKDINWIMNESP